MAQKLLTVVGARPQFIKAAVVSHQLSSVNTIEEILVHTGQHFDYGMSQVFFDELDIPQPKVNLGISGGSHAQMTAKMLVSLEQTVEDVKPDAVLLYGDTNSTLAAALATSKLHYPIVHVEAGTRTKSMTNPEEINRICTDHISGLLLACTKENLHNLIAENLKDRSYFVGDPMMDAFQKYRKIAKCSELIGLDGSRISVPASFYYLTCHREENTRDESTLRSVLSAMNELDSKVVYPVHPRNHNVVQGLKDEFKNIIFCNPVGYLESIYLVGNAKQVITDSGGLQREAFFAEVKCTTILDFQVWPETMVDNRNLLAKPEKNSILSAMGKPQKIDSTYLPFGKGEASVEIVKHISEFLNQGDCK